MNTYFRDKIETAREIISLVNDENIEPVSTADAVLKNRLAQQYGIVQLYSTPYHINDDEHINAVLKAETPDKLEDALRAYTTAIVLWAKAEVETWAWLEEDEAQRFITGEVEA